MRAYFGVFLFLLSGFVATLGQISTTSPPPVPCASKSNSSCAECLQDTKCLWCEPKQQCLDYPVKNILPPRSVCPLSDARWSVCWVNFQTVLITLGALSGLLILALLVCCMCCCCRRHRRRQRVSDDDDDLRAEQQTRARNARQKERRMEMQLRHDKIRQKYGLTKDNPYSRMDEKK
ncbi:pituitary tumor-transforming gene 1 protein-interacting protein-like [Syngnathus acus]|uniref:pituitary tumor-transforming gene 1 protein-interacting protein-like n=1 Tax=Syngnathus acus TaxID=161584 RepID=UPI00188608A7|nr:pituitary tumor-transforming gene 1 protein-interacting protein-like [Syngnathus acus]